MAMDAISQQLNKLIKEDRYKEARTLIRPELKKSEKSGRYLHFWLASMAITYYNEKKYQQALRYSEAALKDAPRCPMVLWDYSGALEMTGRTEEALAIWRRLRRRHLKTLAYGQCGEGLRWAKRLKNDCLFCIAELYREQNKLKEAKSRFLQYIRQRRKGVWSIYTLHDAKKKLKDIRMRQAQKTDKP